MPVGGSRHYAGGGLGQVGMWGCPSCGEDNTGPLEQGCSSCGAGKPASAPPAPPTPPPPAAAPEPGSAEWTGDIGDAWQLRHPDASVADAYRAGYQAGVRAASSAHAAPTPAPPPPADARTYRTMVAALSFFRDQILLVGPEEVETGEWLSADEAATVIEQLQQLLGAPSEVLV